MGYVIYVQTHTGRRGYLSAEDIQGGRGISPWRSAAVVFPTSNEAEEKIAAMGWKNNTSAPTVGVTAYTAYQL